MFDRAVDARDDICSLDRVRVAAEGCEVVVHLAAKVGLGVDVTDIEDYVRDNDLGTAVVLRAAAERGVRRVVYASSMVVYGEGRYRCPQHAITPAGPRTETDLRAGVFDPRCPACGEVLEPLLIPESAALDPRNIYAATKVHGEHLGASWSRETGSPVVALRFHNVYGPGMPRDTPYAGVAALFLSRLLDGRPADVFEDGGQRRNFVFVDDVATAVLAACEVPVPATCTPVNIGAPAVTTVGAMARAMTDAVGGPPPVISGRFRLGDVRHVTADCAAATRLLDWRARVPLAQGVTRMVASGV